MELKKANNKLCYISLVVYSFLFLQEKVKIFTNYFNKFFNIKINVYLLILVYLYETFIAVVFKKSILYNWKMVDYLKHHLISSFFILIGYNCNLVKFYPNMIKYIFLINIGETTRILQTINFNKTIFPINLVLGTYYTVNLIFYEIYESYIYYKNNNPYKYIVSLPILMATYHIVIVLPLLIKYNYKMLLFIINKLKVTFNIRFSQLNMPFIHFVNYIT